MAGGLWDETRLITALNRYKIIISYYWWLLLAFSAGQVIQLSHKWMFRDTYYYMQYIFSPTHFIWYRKWFSGKLSARSFQNRSKKRKVPIVANFNFNFARAAASGQPSSSSIRAAAAAFLIPPRLQITIFLDARGGSRQWRRWAFRWHHTRFLPISLWSTLFLSLRWSHTVYLGLFSAVKIPPAQ